MEVLKSVDGVQSVRLKVAVFAVEKPEIPSKVAGIGIKLTSLAVPLQVPEMVKLSKEPRSIEALIPL